MADAASAITVVAPAHCSQAEFARRQGWSKSYVSKLKAEGRLVITDDGLVDVVASLQRIKATTRADTRADPAVMGQEFGDAKDRNEHYIAELNRIKLQREVGSLLDAAEVIGVVGDAAATLRARLEPLPYRLAPQLAALPHGDEAGMRELLSEAIHDALEELARRFDVLQQRAAA